MSLDQLERVPASAVAYVDGFLRRAGLRSCNAFSFEIGSGGYGLVDAFDPDPDALSSRDIAAMRTLLVLTEDTVKKYVSRALAATGCRTRTELAVRALST